jgi:hypothetical protein
LIAPKIPYPKEKGHEMEFLIRARLLLALRDELNWDAYPEVRTHGHTCRFDIVVYLDRKPVRIIEVKPADAAGVTTTADEFVSRHWRERTEKKLERYRGYDIPVDLVQGIDGVKKYLESAQKRKTPQ